MTKFREKAQAQVKQAVGQMIGDEKLVLEGQEQQHNAEREPDVKGDQNEEEQPRDNPPPKKSREPARRKGPVLE